MTEELSHERCSELLPGFVEGGLPDDLARHVEDHLASCEDCRMEKRGFEALVVDEIEGLTGMERATLESGVMAGISGDAPASTVVPLAPRRRIGGRVAGALGAAATVAVIATLAYFGTSGGLDEVGMGGADTAQEAEEDGPDSDRSGAGRRNRKTAKARGTVSDSAALNSESDGGSAGGDAVQQSAPVPTFRVERRPLTGADLEKRGESSIESVRSAAYFSYDDASGARTLLEQLVEAARASAGEGVADQVEECASQILDTSDPTVPTFGALGTLDDREVLVLGFAYTRARSGSLDRYMVWAWERGSCDVAVDFVDGKIETAN